MTAIRRAIIVVLDSVGAGAMPDAALFGDSGSNTLANTARAVGGLDLPTVAALGFGNIIPILGVPPSDSPSACFGKMAERSAGKDTTTGHWEMAGIITTTPFPVYPDGFPPRIVNAFESAIGRGILGNVPASGTEIIARLGEEHLRTGKPIVYTSADSVFQIAAHEGIVPIDVLYEWCRTARAILTGQDAVARVIARPFIGEPGDFTRTSRRRDFSLSPPGPTLLDHIQDSGGVVIGIGKIEDIFAGQGVTEALHPAGNEAVTEATIQAIASGRGSLIFSNLVDFDMLYGHRNDPEGYAKALEAFDKGLPRLMSALDEGDLLIITADHGCDPTSTSTDHSREYVPLLVMGSGLKNGVDLGIRDTFADVAATIADALGLPNVEAGVSFLPLISSAVRRTN